MKKPQIKISEKVGLPPGTIKYTGSPKDEKTAIHLFRYDHQQISEEHQLDFNEVIKLLNDKHIHWINFDSLHDTNLIKEVGNHFDIHNLTLEDIVNVDHPPKLEQFQNYLFLTLKMVKPVAEQDGTYHLEQISFILSNHILLSFQENKGDPFDNIRERLLSGVAKARTKEADYLLFLLLDAIIDQYFILLEQLLKEDDKIETEVFERPDQHVVGKIIEHKKLVSTLRKTAQPLNDCLKDIIRGEVDFIDPANINYFTDLFDHVKTILDHLDTQRENLISLMEFYMSQVSFQMNKVMQTLTIIATIFIPLTFLAGIYGMNFQYMPELAWKWSYPVLLIVMLVLGVGMYLYMRRKKWF